MKTIYMLLAEFDKACVSIDDLIEHGYLTMNRKTANALASTNKLPFATFRLVDSQKSAYMVHLEELAKWIDACNCSAVKALTA